MSLWVCTYGNSYKFFINRNMIFKEDQILGFLDLKEPDSKSILIPLNISDCKLSKSIELYIEQTSDKNQVNNSITSNRIMWCN